MSMRFVTGERRQGLNRRDRESRSRALHRPAAPLHDLRICSRPSSRCRMDSRRVRFSPQRPHHLWSLFLGRSHHRNHAMILGRRVSTFQSTVGCWYRIETVPTSSSHLSTIFHDSLVRIHDFGLTWLLLTLICTKCLCISRFLPQHCTSMDMQHFGGKHLSTVGVFGRAMTLQLRLSRNLGKACSNPI
ncbi:hypothetical protein D1007_20270 [Hordeum vulgare]|nr:hypothetical protein D1007_20270 [Hordeum vulgare]